MDEAQLEDALEAVDRFIFDGEVLRAIHLFFKRYDHSLLEAIELTGDRIGYLKTHQPELFKVPLEDVGRNVFT